MMRRHLALKGGYTGDHLVKNNAERIHIGANIYIIADDLFWGCIIKRSSSRIVPAKTRMGIVPTGRSL